jgi:hypothetical protein
MHANSFAFNQTNIKIYEPIHTLEPNQNCFGGCRVPSSVHSLLSMSWIFIWAVDKAGLELCIEKGKKKSAAAV